MRGVRWVWPLKKNLAYFCLNGNLNKTAEAKKNGKIVNAGYNGKQEENNHYTMEGIRKANQKAARASNPVQYSFAPLTASL